LRCRDPNPLDRRRKVKIKLGTLCFVAGTVLVLGALLTGTALTPSTQGPGGLNDAEINGGVATLFMADPISQSFCFADGRAGHVFQANEVRNRCSDIDFGNYNAESLTVGIEGGRLGNIVDLGGASDLAQRYSFESADSTGQYFASLRVVDRKAVIIKDRRRQLQQELKEAETLFQAGRVSANAPVRLGHIYLVRITDRFDQTFQRMAKLMVVAYTPNQSVTIRWYLL
jgi:hypothetical protein